jgi:hypothetical protein
MLKNNSTGLGRREGGALCNLTSLFIYRWT